MGKQLKPSSKQTYGYLARALVGITILVCGLLWFRYESVRQAIGHKIVYLGPFLAVLAYRAMLLTQQGASGAGAEYAYSDDDDDDGFHQLNVNPETGAPMMDGIDGFDTMGYTFGSGPDDDW